VEFERNRMNVRGSGGKLEEQKEYNRNGRNMTGTGVM